MSLHPKPHQLSALSDADYLKVCLASCEGMNLQASDLRREDGPSVGATAEEDAAWGVRIYSYPDGAKRMQMGIGWADGKLALYWN